MGVTSEEPHLLPAVDKRYLKIERMAGHRYLKWYYDQKIISFFCSDFESVFA